MANFSRKIKLFLIGVAFLVAIFLFPFSTQAHPGKLDKSGGHNCSAKSKAKGLCTGYHYHNGHGSTTTSATPTTSSSPSQKQQPKTTAPQPEIETKEIKETEEIQFETQQKDDPNLPKEETKVEQEGKNGKKEITYKVTYTDGKETSREKTEEEVIEQPKPKIIAVGTKETQNEQVVGSTTTNGRRSKGWGWLIPLGVISAVIGIIVARRRKS